LSAKSLTRRSGSNRGDGEDENRRVGRVDLAVDRRVRQALLQLPADELIAAWTSCAAASMSRVSSNCRVIDAERSLLVEVIATESRDLAKACSSGVVTDEPGFWTGARQGDADLMSKVDRGQRSARQRTDSRGRRASARRWSEGDGRDRPLDERLRYAHVAGPLAAPPTLPAVTCRAARRDLCCRVAAGIVRQPTTRSPAVNPVR